MTSRQSEREEPKTRKQPALVTEMLSCVLVFAGLGILALGLHDTLRGMTERDCELGVQAACESLRR